MKPDLISVAPLMPKHMDEIAQDFIIHKLPPAGAERDAMLAKLGPNLRFLQTTGFRSGGDAQAAAGAASAAAATVRSTAPVPRIAFPMPMGLFYLARPLTQQPIFPRT